MCLVSMMTRQNNGGHCRLGQSLHSGHHFLGGEGQHGKCTGAEGGISSKHTGELVI